MKILVYGAGVQGSYLANALVRGGNDVTVLARGTRAEQLERDGVAVRHYFQRKTTVDAVRVIRELSPEEGYDLVFVMMKYNDFPAVLPILALNRSENILLVGNNADARAMERYIRENSAANKNVLFGFQLTGGTRDKSGRVICIRGGAGKMLVGSLDGDVPIRPLLEKAFAKAKYSIEFRDDIDDWLKNHIVLIAAMNAILHLHGGDFKGAGRDKALLKQSVLAMGEGFELLEKAGYSITPAGQARIIRGYRRTVVFGLKLYHRLPMAKLVDGSFDEILALFEDFEKLRRKSGLKMPNWDDLRLRSVAKSRG